MNPNPRKRRRIVVISLIAFVFIAAPLIAWAVSQGNDRNPYGEDIKIADYDQKIKNLPKEYRDAITKSLYDMVAHNSPDGTASSIEDATIRDNSETQQELADAAKYAGSFIVDIASIRQSYLVQYEYAVKPEVDGQSGYPALVSCVPEEQLIYGDFGCKNLYEPTGDAVDPIIGLLPHSTLSYELRADTTGDELELVATLRIPSIDLSGDAASKRQAVALYKNEVTTWIREQGLDPAEYAIHWSHSDDGSLEPDPVRGEEAHGAH